MTSIEGHQMTEFVMGDGICVDMKIDFLRLISNPQFGILVHSVDGGRDS